MDREPYKLTMTHIEAEIANVAPLDNHMTPAEQYEVRERKQSLFQLSSDPFAIVANEHRQSISAAETGAAAAATRRRSSAVAPDAAAAAASHHHSGYEGNKLETIVSKAEEPPNFSRNGESSTSGHTTDRDSIDPIGAASNGRGDGHTRIYDAVTTGHDHQHATHAPMPIHAPTHGPTHAPDSYDPDSVAPDEMR